MPGRRRASAARVDLDWRQTMMLFANHLGLTKDPIFTDNVPFWPSEEPR